jgi:hypothetical protein
MMEAVSSSETSVNAHQTTQRKIPEDNQLHTRRCEKQKFHILNDVAACSTSRKESAL